MSTRPAAAASPGGEAAGWRIGVLGLLGDTLPPGGAELLAAATLVVGGREPLARLAVGAPRQVPLAGDLGDALDALRTADAPAVVLAAGDPGFFGIVRRLGTALGPERLASGLRPRRSRPRSRGSACRGTTPSSSPPTRALPTPRSPRRAASRRSPC